MADNKDEFLAKMKQQFEELNQRWNSERRKFESKAKQSSAEARKKLEAEWEELGRLRKQMREKIIDIEVAGENAWDNFKEGAGDAWEDLRSGTESAWGTLSEAFKKAVSRFK